MSAPKSKSTKELLKAAKLPERSVEICTRGDLVADIEVLERELAALLEDRATNGRVATSAKPRLDKADEIQAKRAEMAESTITFRVRALAPKKWRALTTKYQNKDGGLDLLGLMGDAIPVSVISPDDLDAEDWARLMGGTVEEDGEPVEVEAVIPASELGKLIDAVWDLNMRGVSVPKSPLASAVNRTSSAV